MIEPIKITWFLSTLINLLYLKLVFLIILLVFFPHIIRLFLWVIVLSMLLEMLFLDLLIKLVSSFYWRPHAFCGVRQPEGVSMALSNSEKQKRYRERLQAELVFLRELCSFQSLMLFKFFI